ncbi:hypothetical protein ACIKTA_16890 [Hansschlegelia beijingensis]
MSEPPARPRRPYARDQISVDPGDAIVIETPTGGGWGRSEES